MKRIRNQLAYNFILITFCMHGLYAQPSQISSSQSLSVLKYTPLPLGAIKPKGWLYYQLLTMKNGSTGHLDEYYPKLKNDNGWLGGKGDSWEETPYWLDGALPLAYLLNDDSLKTKVLRYVNWTLDHQRPSGFFGPYQIKEKWTKDSLPATERRYSNGYYYSVEPESDWNFGLLKPMIDDPANHVKVITHPFDETKPWTANNTPIEIITKGKQVPAWKLDTNGTAILSVTTRENIYQGEVSKEEKEITLIPYGCTKLRVVAFPVVPE